MTYEAYNGLFKQSKKAPAKGSLPKSDDILRRWKKPCRLAELREKQIRQRLKQEPDGPGGDYLLDIPSSDYRPSYHKLSHLTQSQRDVLAGLANRKTQDHAQAGPPHSSLDSEQEDIFREGESARPENAANEIWNRHGRDRAHGGNFERGSSQ